MYFFFHLFAGAVIGLLIGDILHDRRWVLLCTFGAVIPDIIDKTVGLLVFGDIFGYGRIFSHTLLAALALLVAGVATWKWLKSPIVMGIAAGVISHQVLDLMWRMPKIWLYPLYGPFQGNQTAEFLFSITLRDLKNPSEIFLALLLFAGLLLVVYRDNIRNSFSRHRTAWRGLMTTGVIGLGILSVACGITGYLLLNRSTMKQTLGWITRTGLRGWTGWSLSEHYFIGCILFFLAACLLWRWRRLESVREPQGSR